MNISSIDLARRTALVHALRELAAVASLALHGNEAGVMQAAPLQLCVARLCATYLVSEDHALVVLRVQDLRAPRLRIV